MLDFFKSWYQAKKAEVKRKQVYNDTVTALLEMQEDIKDEWQLLVERSENNLNVPRGTKEVSESDAVIVNTKSEGAGWEIIGSAWKGHIAQDQQIMIAQARRFFRFDPNAQACVYGIVDYLMGRGVTITPKSQDPRIWKLWRNFWTSPDNKMGIRQFEMVKRWFRDGEIFLRYFTKDQAGNQSWQTIIRFIDAIDVRRGGLEVNALTDKTSQGIVFDENDAEVPITYYMRDRYNTAVEHAIPAEEVQHVKFPVADMDQARGESGLQGVMELFTHYKQWLRNRIILNKLRTAIFAVREIDKDSGQSVSTLAQSLPTSGRTASNETKKQNIKPGTMYTPPPGVKIRMESANINAGDVKEDGRNIILQMAAGTRLPEFMFGDASNANYSSTMMAESPFVKHIHFLQSYLEETLWKPMFRKVVEAAVAAGKLTPPADDDIFADETVLEQTVAADNETNDSGDDETQEKETPDTESELEIFYGCDIQWPEVIYRDPKEQAEALALARTNGWISDPTCSAVLGFDYPEEVRKQQQVEEEAEEVGNPLLGKTAGQDAADQEEKDGLDQQNKEEEMVGAGASQNGKNK